MTFDRLWVHGKCDGDADFLSEHKICFKSGLFIKVCSVNEFKEVSIEGPCDNIECICSNSELGLFAVGNHNSFIYIVNYPSTDILAHWSIKENSDFVQMCFIGNDYLFTLEGSHDYNLTLWNWKTATKLENILHAYSFENSPHCFMSIYPGLSNISVFQQGNMIHIYEIEEIYQKACLRRKTVYLPLIGDSVGTSLLVENDVENITFFDKMHSDSWGIHSVLLDKMPLKALCADLSNFEIVKFSDFLTCQERLQAACHCWLPDERLVVACVSGTVILVTLSDLTVKIIHSPPDKQSDGESSYFQCMALNRNGLYVSNDKGDVYLVRDIQNWSLELEVSVKEFPIQMKFSPSFKHLLFVNYNGSLIIYDVDKSKNDITYLVASTDNSPVVGIYISFFHCIIARKNGVIETWDLSSGVPISKLKFSEEIECMNGNPSCSMLLLASKSAYLYAIDFTNVKTLKTVEVVRPSEKAIYLIRCGNWGKLAVLVSYDYYVFVYCIIESKGLEVQGYFLLEYGVKDIAIFTEGINRTTFVSLLGEDEFERSFIVNFILPGDFVGNYKKYWKNMSGVLSKELLNFTEVELGVYCSSIVAHSSVGLLMCLPIEGTILSVPYEEFSSFSLKVATKCCEIKCYGKNCRMLLSFSHTLLLYINEIGELAVRDTQNFKIICNGKFLPFVRSFEFVDDKIIIEGFNSVIICFQLSVLMQSEEKPWTTFINSKQKEKNEILSKLKPALKVKLSPWVHQQCLAFNEAVLQESLDKKKNFEKRFEDLERKLQILVEENFSMPQEYQIQSEEFVFDDDIKEEMLKSREEAIEKYTLSLKETVGKIEKDVSDIHKECVESMMVKGKMLKSLLTGSILFNYSIPVVSENERNIIRYCFRKMQLEQQLRKLKLKQEESSQFEEELNFEDPPAELNRVLIGKKLKKQPFQLHSQEERTDYVHILKFIILKKRLGFNRLFDDITKLRKETIRKINDANLRIKEILLLIGEVRDVWEPEDEDDEHLFEVSSDEIKNASRQLLKKESEEFKGIASAFLDDEWLTKRRICLLKKYEVHVKKENIQRLKKEMNKKFKEIDDMVDNYEKKHASLVQEKLLWDIDIGQNELQLFLLLFSISNFSNFRRWEVYNRKHIENLENELTRYNTAICEAESEVLHNKEENDRLLSEMHALDEEIRQISKISRNKQAFLEAYDQRPEIPCDKITLNPYKSAEKKSISSETLFQDLNTSKNKPPKVPLALWKQLCSLRERKYCLEGKIGEQIYRTNSYKTRLQKVKNLQNFLRKDIMNRRQNLQEIHEMVNRSNFETPMVLSVSDNNLEMKYPDDLNFKEALFLRRFHIESLNCMITNAGSAKLDTIRRISKAHYQIEKNEARIRIDKLKVRDGRKEIEVIKSIPLTKDVQKVISDPEGFSLQDKIDALDKSKQLEMEEISKQINHVAERVSNIDIKRGILRRSINEKKREMEKLKGDIDELRKIERIKERPK